MRPSAPCSRNTLRGAAPRQDAVVDGRAGDIGRKPSCVGREVGVVGLYLSAPCRWAALKRVVNAPIRVSHESTVRTSWQWLVVIGSADTHRNIVVFDGLESG